jgi:hypothetical protein
MSRTSLWACLVLGQLLASSLAAAQSPTAHTEPREAAVSAPETAPAVEREAAPSRTSPVLAPVPEAPTRVHESAQAPGNPSRMTSTWYGWQTLTTDGAAILLSVMALRSNDTPSSNIANTLGWLSVGTFVAGGPIVHFAHGSAGKGLGSLALRVGLPIVAGGLGAMAERTQCSGGDFCGLGGTFLGGLAGVVGTIVIDSAVLGHERVPAHAGNAPMLSLSADGQRTLVTAQGRF